SSLSYRHLPWRCDEQRACRVSSCSCEEDGSILGRIASQPKSCHVYRRTDGEIYTPTGSGLHILRDQSAVNLNHKKYCSCCYRLYRGQYTRKLIRDRIRRSESKIYLCKSDINHFREGKSHPSASHLVILLS